ncbi:MULTISPECIES: 2'-5' RNA ligase family protein [Gordonia]|uniref:2'-5' RNA ligase family protein n=1 Tax=Gordonia TaxID=2053 RepID=UPI00200A2AA2|nr:2'-5' RNA ligase family protein [Gordonia terrae]UPW07257.1 2'-5' RNA ligase family protein [Gordonia terrae]
MAHSLELLLDDSSDQQVRAEWDALAAAGLPHQGRVASATNRPHVTLAAASRIDPQADAALAGVAMRLPVGMRLGAPILFGAAGRSTLARLVVPSTELLSAHAQVCRLAAGFIGSRPAGSATSPGHHGTAFAHTTPGRWTPHVTLARRMDAEQLARALVVLDLRAEIAGEFTALRRWDPDEGTDVILAGRAC